MNTGQTMLTMGALALLSILTLNFYRTIGMSGRNIERSQTGITASTLATSYIEIAMDKWFDENSEGTFITRADIGMLSLSLGYDSEDDTNPGETNFDKFDDFDDFNNFTKIDTINGRVYQSNFVVYYVNPLDITRKVNTQTFMKRMDISVVQIYPRIDSTEATVFDTAKVTCVMGYFHYE